MTKPQPDYLSYLLRLWRANGDDESLPGAERPVWRASLECALTGKKQAFASLDDLFAFLRRQTGVTSEVEGGDE
jgi:hypothetical protein